ncbi:MAG TPA: ribosome biogenesis GTPase Der, partial [candidate division Zixibacteria bacterium]|nr:ribosome biogenesis GTPase Der [candidate division Zixibacteria bacterium]
MKIPTVAIIGRPNVGKSSLFNRFLQKRIAVVDEQPGVTRDRNYAVCDWAGQEFYLIDTGGIVPDSSDLMEKLITDQTDFAINESDLVLFVVDSHIGIDSVDLKIAKSLTKEKKRCLLISNKVDNQESELQIYEFMKLGLGEPVPVSATVGLGVGELLDKLVEALPEQAPDSLDSSNTVRIALVGRPNVGKSSFINKLVGYDRLIVSPIAGTTRDSVDTPFEFDGDRFTLVDTAGLRRKYKGQESVEFYTTLRTDRALEASDVALVLIDATEKVSSQDQRILDKVTSMRR